MTRDELRQLIAEVQKRQRVLMNVEAKAYIVTRPDAYMSRFQPFVTHVREAGSITNTECGALLGVDATRAYYLLKKLCDTGRLRPKGKGKWRTYILP